MARTFRTIAILAGVLVTAAFVVFLVNQTREIVAFAATFDPAAGKAVLWGLLALYFVCVATPLVLILRLPKSVAPPAEDDAEAIGRHVAVLRRRLRANPGTAGLALSTREDVEAAIDVLDERSDELIRGNGSRVFLTTAISQNGGLDSLVVLALQTRMIWQVAHVYFQRPSVRDMAWLYTNVAGTAFLAGELDDAELAEHIQPVISQVLGSAPAAIPGLQAVTTVFANSVFTGTANAFLTLRVGVIAKRYCGALVRPERRRLRRLAAAEAARMLGGIAMQGGRDLSVAFARASSRKVGDTVRGLGGRVTGAARRTGSAVSEAMRRSGSAMGDAMGETMIDVFAPGGPPPPAGAPAGPSSSPAQGTGDPGSSQPSDRGGS